jgi:hypothetical protein
MKLIIPVLFFIFATICITFYMYGYHEYLCKLNYDYPFQDPTLPIDIRLDNLMSLLTPEEKVIRKFIFTIFLLTLTIIISFFFVFKIDMLWMDGTTPGIIS